MVRGIGFTLMVNGSVAETLDVGEQARIQALKHHPRLLEALGMLEKEFGLAQPQQQ